MIFLSLLANIAVDFWRYYIKPKTGPRAGFAFLAHPRDLGDLRRLMHVLKFVPDKLINGILRSFVPFTVAAIYRGHIPNFIISIPLTGADMLADKALARRMVKRAFILAQRRGVKIVGLGAYTASVTFGGTDLLDLKDDGIFITTGNTFTAIVAVKQLKDFLNREKQNGRTFPQFLNCAVVGASGSVGRGITELILRGGDFDKYILVGKTPERLQLLKDGLIKDGLFDPTKILITNSLEAIKTADIVFVATSSSELLIRPEFIKAGAIIYDVTQPRNVSLSTFINRPDVKIIDGGLVKTPGIDYKMVLDLPPNYAFACLAETLILSAEKINRDFIGPVDLESITLLESVFPKYGFKI